jgi:hypothetical protein
MLLRYLAAVGVALALWPVVAGQAMPPAFQATVQGRLVTSRGEPIANVTVTVAIPRLNIERRVETDANGRFRVRLSLPVGAHDVLVAIPQLREPVRRQVTVSILERDRFVDLHNIVVPDAPIFNLPEPDAPPGPPRSNDGLVPDLFWNLWTERAVLDKQTTPSFQPRDAVGQTAGTVVVLDLASLAYLPDNKLVTSKSGGETFVALVKKAIATTQPTLPLQVVLLADPAFFERPHLAEQVLEVNLDRLRQYSPASVPAPDAVFTQLSSGKPPAFMFGRALFQLKTKGRTGWAGLTASIWANGRPIEDITTTVCVTPDVNLVAEKACGVRPRRDSALGGFDSLRAALGGQPHPDAALHLVTLDGSSDVFGIMSVKGRQEKRAWSLDKDAATVRSLLGDTIFNALVTAETDEEWERNGDALHGLLFPNTVEGARDASADLEAVIARDATAVGNDAPSVYLRMLSRDSPAFVFPIGAVLVKGRALGFQARIEQPLTEQTYEAPASCISQWAIVAPPFPFPSDAALGEVREKADDSLRVIESAATRPFSSIGTFADWMRRDEVETSSFGLFILSHHKRNQLHFVEADKMTSPNVKRRFAEPSLAIFNACGSVNPLAQEFVVEFNKRGVTSIIATVAEVEAPMAADFTACWVKTLSALPQGGDTVASAFAQTISCLHGIQNDAGVSKYGPKVLKYVLLGDGSTTLCPLKRND